MKRLVYKILRYSGLPFIFREFIQKNKISILLFHDISKETAEKTFSYLIKKYNIIDLDDFINASLRNDKSNIPKKALIITFDDGHIGNYNMLPVIEKYNIPVTIFLCSSIINTNRHFWWKFKKTDFLFSKLKQLSNSERLAMLQNYGFNNEKEFENPQALSKEQVLEMSNCINMQAHTLFHPFLPKCTDKEAQIEIVKSKEILEKEYGFNINAMAYPNGDYSNRDIKIAKKAGYTCGITVDFGFNTLKTDLFRLKRLSVNDTTDMNELIIKSSGVWSFFKTLNGKIQDHGFTNKVENSS